MAVVFSTGCDARSGSLQRMVRPVGSSGSESVIGHRPEDFVDSFPAKIDGDTATAARELTLGRMDDREMAAKAISTFIVPVAVLPFEKCAPILRKALGCRVFRYPLLYLAGSLTQISYFLLKCHDLIFDCHNSFRFGVSFDAWRRRRTREWA